MLVNNTKMGYYLRAGCGGASYYDLDGDGEAAEHQDMGIDDTDYVVTNTSTLRINPEQRVVETPFESNRSSQDTPQEAFGSFSVLNFDDDSVSITVTIEYVGNGSPESALDATYDLEPTSGYEIYRVTEQPGTYLVTVTVDSTSYQYRWSPKTETDAKPFSIVVWPDRTVTFEPRPVIEY